MRSTAAHRPGSEIKLTIATAHSENTPKWGSFLAPAWRVPNLNKKQFKRFNPC